MFALTFAKRKIGATPTPTRVIGYSLVKAPVLLASTEKCAISIGAFDGAVEHSYIGGYKLQMKLLVQAVCADVKWPLFVHFESCMWFFTDHPYFVVMEVFWKKVYFSSLKYCKSVTFIPHVSFDAN